MQDIDTEDNKKMNIYAKIDDKSSHDVLEGTEDTKRNQLSQQSGRESEKIRVYKAVTACLVLLCVLLLTAVIMLCVLVYTNNQKFQIKNKKNTEERDQLLTKNTKLTEMSDELLVKFNNISKLCEHLKKNELWTLLHEGWIYYQFHFYYISSEQKTWTESAKYCSEKGANLIIINNREEQDFVRNIFNTTAWIGLSDIDEEGKWKWVDGSTLTTGFWAPTEPNSNLGEEDCVVTYLQWADYPCNHAFKWICEKTIF